MTGRRVVVTGLGVIGASGTEVDGFWRRVCEAPDGPVHGAVGGFDPKRWLSAKQVRRSDPFARYAVAASRAAWEDAGSPAASPTRAGVVLSTVYGALESMDLEAAGWVDGGDDAVSPFLTAAACENASAAMVSADLGWRGPSKVVVSACAGGTHAVADAADLIRAGRGDVLVAGGSQGRITPLLLQAYRNLRVLSPSGHVRPFDRRRDGFVFAEGAAVLLLEALDAAQDRGARIYAEVLGSANTNDADSMVSPSGRGAVECIEAALADAGIEPGDVGHVNAHGTGTMLNDLREAEALHAVFGPTPPPVTSIKRVIGHAAGASGAFEAVASVLTLYHGLIPPVGHDVQPDPELDLDLVIGAPRPWSPSALLSNSFGLGGHNGCVIFGPAPR